MLEDHKQQRRFPRVSLLADAEYRVLNDEEENNLSGKITVIGQGGCFLQTKTAFTKGTKVHLSFNLGGRQYNLIGEVRCQIQYSWTSKVAQYPGMGIEFIAAPEEDQQTIAEYVKQMLAVRKG